MYINQRVSKLSCAGTMETQRAKTGILANQLEVLGASGRVEGRRVGREERTRIIEADDAEDAVEVPSSLYSGSNPLNTIIGVFIII